MEIFHRCGQNFSSIISYRSGVDCQLKFMENTLSSQRTTNILLIVLIIIVVAFFFHFEKKVNNIAGWLSTIDDNTSSLDSIKDNTDYLEGYLEAIKNNTRYLPY